MDPKDIVKADGAKKLAELRVKKASIDAQKIRLNAEEARLKTEEDRIKAAMGLHPPIIARYVPTYIPSVESLVIARAFSARSHAILSCVQERWNDGMY